MFVEEPTVPLSFFMHEKKTEDSHNLFLRKVSQTVPEFDIKEGYVSINKKLIKSTKN